MTSTERSEATSQNIDTLGAEYKKIYPKQTIGEAKHAGVDEGSAGVTFGGSISESVLEAERQRKEAEEKKAKEHEEAIVKAMEANMNNWGSAMTATIKEVMEGKEVKE